MASLEGNAVFLSPDNISSWFFSLLKNFPTRAIFFLNRQGDWQKTPLTWRDLVAHELLFSLKNEGQEKYQGWWEEAFSLAQQKEFISLLNRVVSAWQTLDFPLEGPFVPRELTGEEIIPSALSFSPEKKDIWPGGDPFLLFFEFIIGFILWVCLRRQIETSFSHWDVTSGWRKEYFARRFREWEDNLNASLSEEEKKVWHSLAADWGRAISAWFGPIIDLITAQQRILFELNHLLSKLETPANKEEVYATIREKIQPPMGIVTHLPSSLLFPSLGLLFCPEIEITSGIQYLASVNLSIFRDCRTADYLLWALDSLPLAYTKIRENIIYTLGCLREERAVPLLVRVLEAPDCLQEESSEAMIACPLREQKEEAIWALGKMGLAATKTIPYLSQYTHHPSSTIKTSLAWSLGEIGRAQKGKMGGVSADIIISLMTLLKEKDKEVFEEAVSALKKIQMPEFIHFLYLYNIGAISLLGLKNAERGLNELSATLNYLLQTKKRVIMAVTGDSGTGKTYFCQVLASGQAGYKRDEVWHLMRDSKTGRKIFNRLLGLAWLKQHIDPAYYQDDSLSEYPVDPEEYWPLFLDSCQPKRLIILDGCRDQDYFQRVIDFFYKQGELDIVVNFRSNYSTRRLNLEEREKALESVKLHLSFKEEPALEDTLFYQDGKLILFDLDNSISCRLDQEEISEVFSRREIAHWEEFIQLGSFPAEEEVTITAVREFSVEEAPLIWTEEAWPESRRISITATEEIKEPRLNEDLETEPNLLLTIPWPELKPDWLFFYAQGQIAGVSEEGHIFVFSFLDNRLFYSSLCDKVSACTLLGRKFYLQTEKQGWLNLSLEKNEVLLQGHQVLPATKICSYPPHNLIMAHTDGSLSFWDVARQKRQRFPMNISPVVALTVDRRGQVYLASSKEIFCLDLEKKIRKKAFFPGQEIKLLQVFSRDQVVSFSLEAQDLTWKLNLVDFNQAKVKSFSLPSLEMISNCTVTPDGRMIIHGHRRTIPKGEPISSLLILDIQENRGFLSRLNRTNYEADGLLLMGPRIITCGQEPDGSRALRVWGSKLFVRAESSKLKIKPV